MSPRRRARKALTLAEMLVSTLIIAFVLVELRIQNVDAMESFRRAKDNLSGTWMANTLINELMAEELPNFDADDDNEQNRGYLSGNGTFESFLADAYPEVHGQMGEKRLELFKQWTYTWTKEVVLINEKGEKRTDSSGYPPDYSEEAADLTDEDVAELREDDPNYEDPRELANLPTAQVIRIRLVLSPPGASENAPTDSSKGVIGGDEEDQLYDPVPEEAPELSDDEKAERTAQRRKHIVLIRYIDAEGLRTSLVIPPNIDPFDPNASGNTPGPNR